MRLRTILFRPPGEPTLVPKPREPGHLAFFFRFRPWNQIVPSDLSQECRRFALEGRMRELPIRPNSIDILFGLFAVLLLTVCAFSRL